VLLFVEEGLGELKHVESQFIVGKHCNSLDGVLPHSFIGKLGVK